MQEVERLEPWDFLSTVKSSKGDTTHKHTNCKAHTIHADRRKETNTQRRERQAQHAHKGKEREVDGLNLLEDEGSGRSPDSQRSNREE